MNNNYRDKSCDYMRGFLVVIMILSHVKAVTTGEDYFCLYVNLSAFSGFLFCSGYACQLSSLRREKANAHGLIKNFVKIMFIYYASAFFHIAISEDNLFFENVKQILFMERLAGFSEFLVSFAYLNIVILILFPLMKKIISSGGYLIIAIMITLLSTFIPYDLITIPWIGPLIGGEPSNYFPLLQYGSYFLMGAFVSKIVTIRESASRSVVVSDTDNKLLNFATRYKYVLLVVCLIGTLAFMVKVHVLKQFPERFGPDLIWVAGGFFLVYIYYYGSRLLAQEDRFKGKLFDYVRSSLSYTGKHSLRFLLVSNIFVFSAERVGIASLIDNHQLRFGVYAIITFVCCVLSCWEVSTE